MSTPAHTCCNAVSLADLCFPADDLAGASLHSDVFAILNQRPGSSQGRRAANRPEPQAADDRKPHPAPGAPEPYDGPSNPNDQGRDGRGDDQAGGAVAATAH